MKSNKSVKSFLCSFLKTFFLYLIRQNTEGLHSELPVRNFKMKQKTSLCFRKFSKQKKKHFYLHKNTYGRSISPLILKPEDTFVFILRATSMIISAPTQALALNVNFRKLPQVSSLPS